MVFNSIAALQAAAIPTDNFANVLGYYTSGDGSGGDFYWDNTDTTTTDNGGTVFVSTVPGVTGRWKRLYSGAIDVKWFGVNNINFIQNAIDFAHDASITDIYIPRSVHFDINDYDLKSNVNIFHYGDTNEHILFLNNKNPNETCVNEFNISSPYHTGLIIDTWNTDSSETQETSTKRNSSIVIRRNGLSTWQTSYSALGIVNNKLDYNGKIILTINTSSNTDGVLSLKLNGIDYNVNVQNGDSQESIASKIFNSDFGNYWNYKELNNNIVTLHPSKETVFIVTSNPLTATYNIILDGDEYNVPIASDDSTVDIASKLNGSSIIPRNKYVSYLHGSAVVFYPLSGTVNQESSCQIINDLGISIDISITGYVNTYDRSSFSPNGYLGIGMSNARQYQLEVANSIRILSASNENYATGTNAIFVLENENLKVSKSLRLDDIGNFLIIANDKISKIFSLDNGGNVSSISSLTGNNIFSNRFTFLNTNRYITHVQTNGENMIYITNNLGTNYIARFSDANLLELNISGSYKPVHTIQSGAYNQKPNVNIIGYQYFDIDLNKPIWWNGSNWVDATGTTV